MASSAARKLLKIAATLPAWAHNKIKSALPYLCCHLRNYQRAEFILFSVIPADAGTQTCNQYICGKPGSPKFTNEVQHQTKVMVSPWEPNINSLASKTAARLPFYVPKGVRSGKSLQVWIARHRP